jgi:membrane protease YdiL (CAAX protease family)
MVIGSNVIRALSLEYPIATALGLLSVAGLFRLIDIFVLRLDEIWGEIIVSKIAGVVLLLGFLAATGAGLAASGFHARAVVPSLFLGLGLTVAALLVGYSAEFILQAWGGQAPAIKLLAIDPKSGLAGAAGFALLLLIGNFINSFAEEGLFRGVLIPLFSREVDPWTTLLVSALLFGLWHLPWALKAILNESGASAAPIAWHLLSNFLPQTLLGVAWGYLYMRTGNLWGPWAAHTLTNSAVNFLHVQSSAGMDTGLSIRMIVFTVVMLLGLVVIQRVSQALNLPMIAPWGA